jgi:hypothetical protein
MNKLLATTLESRFRVYDLRTQVRHPRAKRWTPNVLAPCAGCAQGV